MNKVYKVITTAALTGMLLVGAAWGTAEAANLAAAKAPAKNSGTQSAAPAASVTQNGITLGISETLYDGNLIKFTLKRSGDGLNGGITDRKYDDNTQEYVMEKGAIEQMDILINGKELNKIGKGTRATMPNMVWGPGVTPDTAIVTLVDASWLGDKIEAFPDKFKLTAKVTLAGVAKPFTLHVQMQKSAAKPIALKPNLTKKSGKFSSTLSKLNLTNNTVRFQFIEKGREKGKPSNISYEFVDDQGKELKMLAGFGTDENNKNGDWYMNFVTDAVSKDAKSIIIKAYSPEFEEAGATSGKYKLDSNGEVVKNYIKELEMSVKVR